MDSIAFKPRPAAPARNVALRDPVAVRETNDTELDVAKAVTAASHSGGSNDQPHHDEPSARELPVDTSGRDVLFDFNDVRAAHPDSLGQALIRQRSYHTQPSNDNPDQDNPASDAHTNIEV